METNVNYTIVGVFVVSLLAVIILGIIWLSAGFSVEKYTMYRVYMTESVSGLSIDAPVEYNGVNIGAVKSIKLNSHNPHLVDILLQIKSNTPITQATRATLNIRGLTGITYMALQDKGSDMRPLRIRDGQEYPVIETSPSLFLRLDTALSNLNTNLTQVATSMRSLLDDENLRSIKFTLSSMREISRTLAANSAQFTMMMHNTAKASQTLVPAMDTFMTQTLPSVNYAIHNLDTVSHNLSEISTEIKQNPAILIRGKAPQALGPGEK
jgi:phospholipid/cholesterol/gamma-HCH transport system substrate-binding protein